MNLDEFRFCFGCRYRQRNLKPRKYLTCGLHDFEVDSSDGCDDWFPRDLPSGVSYVSEEIDVSSKL